jgi:hypothetical protein
MGSHHELNLLLPRLKNAAFSFFKGVKLAEDLPSTELLLPLNELIFLVFLVL